MNKLKSYFDKKKEQQNQKSSTDDKNNNNSMSNNQMNDNNSTSGSKLKDIKISDKFVIGGKVSQNAEFSDLVRIISMERLQSQHVDKENMQKMLKNKSLNYSLEDKVIMTLLRPKDWVNRPLEEEDSTFCLDISMYENSPRTANGIKSRSSCKSFWRYSWSISRFNAIF